MIYLTQNKHWNIIEEYNIDKLLYLLVDRQNNKGNLYFVWYNDKNLCHRDYDLPSLVWSDGDVFWFKNDERYRKNNKSAVIRNDGVKEY